MIIRQWELVNSMNQGAGMYKDNASYEPWELTDTIWYTSYKRRPTDVINMD